jgi:elongation factor P
MATTNDFKRGLRIEIDGDPWRVLEIATKTPSARGAQTLVKVKVRNIRTKQVLEKTFKAGETIKLPDFEIKPCQYLYDDGDGSYFFMDENSYEQFPLEHSVIAYELGFIRPSDSIRAMFFDGECIGIEIENNVTLEVTQTDPGVKGDTVNNVTKRALLETGLEIQVPLFVNEGDKLLIDTRESRYIKRA